jgi:GH43 family beta-xylosidase
MASGHRLWAVENPSPDPLAGEWTFKGQVTDASDRWAIDGSVFEDRGKLYLIWSGWEGDTNGTQNIYIARMKNPWTVESASLRVSTPKYPWEKVGDVDQKKSLQDPPHIDVNEGPEILQHDDKIFVIYSAAPAGRTITNWAWLQPYPEATCLTRRHGRNLPTGF